MFLFHIFYSLAEDRCSLFVLRFTLDEFRCSMDEKRWTLFVIRCLMLVVRWTKHVGRCSMFEIRCSLNGRRRTVNCDRLNLKYILNIFLISDVLTKTAARKTMISRIKMQGDSFFLAITATCKVFILVFITYNSHINLEGA
jgi:hypothetical protein